MKGVQLADGGGHLRHLGDGRQGEGGEEKGAHQVEDEGVDDEHPKEEQRPVPPVLGHHIGQGEEGGQHRKEEEGRLDGDEVGAHKKHRLAACTLENITALSLHTCSAKSRCNF